MCRNNEVCNILKGNEIQYNSIKYELIHLAINRDFLVSVCF